MSSVLNRENKLPQVTQELLDHLKTKYPLRLFKEMKSYEEVKEYQGKQEVIDYLATLLDR
ncbi:hypothetical protein ASG03_10180 [Rhizobium sp. Leaf341]|nr:hypothetical protein ASG03_10180 [Rhizobium sp. Leaf341]